MTVKVPEQESDLELCCKNFTLAGIEGCSRLGKEDHQHKESTGGWERGTACGFGQTWVFTAKSQDPKEARVIPGVPLR